MRPTSLNCVYELAQKDERVVFIGSDLGPGVLDEFKKNIPERFFMEGVAEQHIVGMAAGMALEGFIPYVNTIATFLTRRCFEQNMIDLGLHRTNVRLISNGGGLVYAPLGPTHLAIEDISIMRTIPNMTIVSPADANEMRRFMMQTLDHEGPIYIRLAKGYDPIVTPDDIPFKIGKAIKVKNGNDVLLVTTGITLGIAKEVSDALTKENINCSILHMHTLKPIDKEALIQSSNEVQSVITLEEHTIVGGLGSACAELILEEGINIKNFKRIGINDLFPSGYGSQADMMKRNGLSVENVISTIKKFK
jgi:transketolase